MIQIILSLLIILNTVTLFSQKNSASFDKEYSTITKYSNSNYYILRIFSRAEGAVKAKYFAVDPHNQYKKWKNEKKILFLTEATFSNSLNPENTKPVGLTVDNGRLVNRNIDHIMDGMVIIYNEGRQQGGVAVIDLDTKPVRVERTYGSGIYDSYYPRSSSSDRENFIQWGKHQGVTLFQTQLLYSKDRDENFKNIYYGQKRERRFWALCRKDRKVYHVVIDVPTYEYLNVAAKKTKELLEEEGLEVFYILNFETGSGNMLYAHNGDFLKGIVYPERLANTRNLLVYYRD
ncbi:MAG: hypothetical protein ACRBFS_13985 [Aureispira sp.]